MPRMSSKQKKHSTNGHTNRIADIPGDESAVEDGGDVKRTEVSITPPNFRTAVFLITGNAPYCQHKFTQKAFEQMKAKQEAGDKAKKGTKREAKNFKQCFEQAQYISKEGWNGIPATGFRAAMVSACRTVGFKMTHAKLGFFILADGYDAQCHKPLVKITKGSPRQIEDPLPNDNGKMDIRVRPLWDAGWQCKLRIQFDADMFSMDDIANLLHRAGIQVGIGEGRPDSKNCVGIGWGTFEISNE